MQRHVEPAVHALARACSAHIDDTGAVPSRNPEELLEIFTLLTWTAGALSDAGLMADEALIQTIDRIAPVLRTLRHSDGTLTAAVRGFTVAGVDWKGGLITRWPVLATRSVRRRNLTWVSCVFLRAAHR